MSINVFGNSFSSHNNTNKIDTSLFVEKPCLRSNYIESINEQKLDMKIHFSIRNLPDPFSIREAASKNYKDTFFKFPV